MPRRREHGTGLPVWVDIWSPDPSASARFYDGVFGWEALDIAPPQLADYLVFSLDGHAVAGVGLSPNGLPSPTWRTFFAVDDIDATVEHAQELGATVSIKPYSIPGEGRTALLTDPRGATFGLWHSPQGSGVELVDEPSTFCWNQLVTHDADASRAFYEPLFGWTLQRGDDPGIVPYSQWYRDGRAAGGILHDDHKLLPLVPEQWLVWFAVTNAEATARQVTELGGSVAVPPTDVATGRFAALCDPHGAFFTVFEFGASR